LKKYPSNSSAAQLVFFTEHQLIQKCMPEKMYQGTRRARGAVKIFLEFSVGTDLRKK
jgi:hypothetical protein